MNYSAQGSRGAVGILDVTRNLLRRARGAVDLVSSRMKNGLSPNGGLPAFLIIGAQRAGTTSLYRYLAEHPSVAPATQKELHFFDNHFHKGIKWYCGQFTRRTEGQVAGEASPYYLFHPLAAARAHATVPEAKLIVLLRNPVQRAISHHQHEVRRGKETLSFPDALSAEDERLRGEAERIKSTGTYRSMEHQCYSYRSRGCYIDQLEEWLRLFPRANLLPIVSERFYSAPQETLKQVTDFLGLPALPEHVQAIHANNQGSYTPLDDALRRSLIEYYQPFNERLARFLGEDLPWD